MSDEASQGLSALHVVLFEPEIPPNTGNIIRLCANNGAQLHLIHPLGFELEEKRLRRAGLDYHEWASVKEHQSFSEFVQEVSPNRVLAFSTKGKDYYHQFAYEAGDAILFGPETRGLPDTVLNNLPAEHILRLPMLPDSRSLNLSNTVAIACYQVWQQWEFNDGL